MYTCVCRFGSAFTSKREANSVRKELPCTCKRLAICAETGPFVLTKKLCKRDEQNLLQKRKQHRTRSALLAQARGRAR